MMGNRVNSRAFREIGKPFLYGEKWMMKSVLTSLTLKNSKTYYIVKKFQVIGKAIFFFYFFYLIICNAE